MYEDPITKAFEALEAELYQAVGKMIATWSQVESWLAHLLTLLLFRNGTGRQGETIYYAVQNINPRLKIVEAALFSRTDIAPEIRSQFKKIIKKIEYEASERNNIIHGDFIRGSVSDSEIAIAISPKIFSDMKRLKPPAGVKKLGYDTADIRRHIERISNLRDALWALYGDIPDAKDSKPPKSSKEYLAAWQESRAQCEWPSINRRSED